MWVLVYTGVAYRGYYWTALDTQGKATQLPNAFPDVDIEALFRLLDLRRPSLLLALSRGHPIVILSGMPSSRRDETNQPFRVSLVVRLDLGTEQKARALACAMFDTAESSEESVGVFRRDRLQCLVEAITDTSFPSSAGKSGEAAPAYEVAPILLHTLNTIIDDELQRSNYGCRPLALMPLQGARHSVRMRAQLVEQILRPFALPAPAETPVLPVVVVTGIIGTEVLIDAGVLYSLTDLLSSEEWQTLVPSQTRHEVGAHGSPDVRLEKAPWRVPACVEAFCQWVFSWWPRHDTSSTSTPHGDSRTTATDSIDPNELERVWGTKKPKV